MGTLPYTTVEADWQLVSGYLPHIDVAPTVSRATSSSRKGKMEIKLETKDRQKPVGINWYP